jgi:hypothetical protein
MILHSIKYYYNTLWVDKSNPLCVDDWLYSSGGDNGRLYAPNTFSEIRPDMVGYRVIGQSMKSSLPSTVPYVDLDYPSSTNSPLGSYHNIHTLLARISHIGEYMEINNGCNNLHVEWGIQLRNAAKELVEAQKKLYTEETLIKAMKYSSEITNNKLKNLYDYFHNLKPVPESIEIEINESKLDFTGQPCVGDNKPLTYVKDGKTYLKVKTK